MPAIIIGLVSIETKVDLKYLALENLIFYVDLLPHI